MLITAGGAGAPAAGKNHGSPARKNRAIPCTITARAWDFPNNGAENVMVYHDLSGRKSAEGACRGQKGQVRRPKNGQSWKMQYRAYTGPPCGIIPCTGA